MGAKGCAIAQNVAKSTGYHLVRFRHQMFLNTGSRRGFSPNFDLNRVPSKKWLYLGSTLTDFEFFCFLAYDLYFSMLQTVWKNIENSLNYSDFPWGVRNAPPCIKIDFWVYVFVLAVKPVKLNEIKRSTYQKNSQKIYFRTKNKLSKSVKKWTNYSKNKLCT